MTQKPTPRRAVFKSVWTWVVLIALSLAFLPVGFSRELFSLAALAREPSQTDSDWDIVTVDSEGGYGVDTSLALDSGGFPRIMYWLDAGKYAFKDAEGWDSVVFDDNGLDYSLAIGPDDYPRVCYRNLTQIDYAYQGADGWHNVFLLGYIQTETYTSLALDDEGYPYCSFYWDRDIYADLYLYYQDAEGWDYVNVPDPDPLHRGAYNSLALDSDGNPHISYYHSTLDVLRYAYRDNAGWHFKTVDGERYVGAHTSLALDDSGYPHISYFYCGTIYYSECDTMDLRYAYQDASGWYTETVDAAGEVGTFTSLALDSSGYPHISYYDVGQGDLKYAYQDDGGWHIETLDSEGDVGKYTSLALGEDGSVHISYFDDANDNLKYAYQEGTAPGPSRFVYLPTIIR